jgi:D-glycero-D-manno-heptose 1,7-bisphosphate phosphatase
MSKGMAAAGEPQAVGPTEQREAVQTMTESPLRPAVFLDLNGTLVVPVRPSALSEYEAIDCAAEAVSVLSGAGFACPVITVQSKIGKGLFTEREFLSWFESFRARFAARQAFIDGPYVCPHRYAESCACKKPTGLLYRRAANELGLDFARSFVIGDSVEYMQAAQLLGCPGVLVRTGWPIGSDAESRSSHVSADVLDASRWIVATLG